MTRKNLKAARIEKGMTQQQVADKIGISLVHYQKIEEGSRTGSFYIWDNLEDLFSIHQRKLRELL
ncbi:MAG: helix-turn-helix transcriptional regulator [Lachnospiraceae bacterium]|nr:helix-turn-helix transcriptional regulator [Lachnospiraceae bacterium]